jgi:TPR repeat protein
MKKGAEKKNGDAQVYFGMMYLQGLGVGKKRRKAMKWFE